ncbi:hypothetical protein AAEU76_004979 [Salmonella enterica subsp. enterica serovar Wedding]
MSSLMVLLKAHKKRRHPERHRTGGHGALSTLLLSGALATAATVIFLPGQALAAQVASTTLTLKTRVTHATCNLTRNGITPAGVQVVPLPVVNPGEVSQSGEWLGDIVPLNLGVRCSVAPETGVGMSLVITPSQTDADYNGAAIASTKSDGKNGPDLLIVNTGSSNVPVSFNPELVTDSQSCSHSGQDCVTLSATGAGASDWRLPLGVRVFIPAGNKRTDMLTPGTWQAAITLNVAYQ